MALSLYNHGNMAFAPSSRYLQRVYLHVSVFSCSDDGYLALFLGFSFANSNLMSVTGKDPTEDYSYQIGNLEIPDYGDVILNDTANSVGTRNFRDFIMSLGFDCRSMITCYDFMSETDCCEDAEETMGLYGKCFRFKEKTQYVGGVGYGHFFKIKVDHYRSQGAASDFPVDGVIVRFANSDKDVEYQGRFVGTGTRTQIGLRRTRGTFLSTKHYQCKEYAASEMSRSGCIYNCLFHASYFTALLFTAV